MSNPAEAARKKKNNYRPQPDRYAAIVIEASTGYVISEKNPDKKLFPASLTKMMTLYLAFEAMAEGRLNKNEYIPVSKRAAAQEPSSLGLKPGDAIRVENVILGIATKSANDCAVALAEAIGGSEDRFARAMTAKARALGMNSTRFVNASGLHNPAQFTSARDMAALSRALIRDYPAYYHYFSTNAFTYEGRTYLNHNRLMSTYPGMDGLKTGYVYASGFNLAASAVQDGTRLIGVVFGGKTARSRNQAMARLLDDSFARIGNVRVAALAKSDSQKTLPVRKPANLRSTPAAELVTEAHAGSGAMMDQGDADINDDAKAARILYGKPPAVASPAPAVRSATVTKGGWAVQIGSFSSRDAGLQALRTAKAALYGVANSGTDTIAPLMTSRGMIYRAKLSGLARPDADQVCRILKGNCLILSAQ